ncbi:MAG TPA: hypothetical protein VGL92_11360 [Acidimicrobiia bacterium]
MNSPDVSRPADPEILKACCAAAYEQDLVALLLGEELPPRRTRPHPAPGPDA